MSPLKFFEELERKSRQPTIDLTDIAKHVRTGAADPRTARHLAAYLARTVTGSLPHYKRLIRRVR